MANRRDFLKLLGATVAGNFLGHSQNVGQAVSASTGLGATSYQGNDFSNWEVIVGDGIYTAPGEPPVNQNDIETVNYGSYSELRANIQRRRIMAHNITVKKIIDDNAFDYVHTCRYKFRLPYIPSTSNTYLNPQTIEGGFFIWDGSHTRRDYGLGFQWMLNPWGGSDFSFGDIRCWTDHNDGSWVKVGELPPDTLWHEVIFVFDFRWKTTALVIDGQHYPSSFAGTTKPDTWGTETAAKLQAEIISLYPGDEGDGTLHKTEFKDWSWVWESYGTCNVMLPLIMKEM